MGLGYLNAQFESIPGNETNSPTLSTKSIYFPVITSKPDLNPDPMERDDELRNQDQPLPVLEDAHDPAWDYVSRAYPDLIGFLLKGMLGAPTSTAGNGVITDPDLVVIPTGATRHVFTAPFGPSGASPQTMQLIHAYKDQGVFFKQKGAAVERVQLESPEKGGVRFNTNGPAAYMARISDPSLSASYESLAVRPWVRGDLTLTWLTGGGTVEDFGVEVNQPVDMVRSLGIKSKFPDVVEKGEGLIVFTSTIAKRQLDTDDWDALKAATSFSATAKWVSDSIIASAYPYKVFIEMPGCQLVGGEVDDLSNRRRHGANYTAKATYDGTNASAKITVVNATATTGYS